MKKVTFRELIRYTESFGVHCIGEERTSIGIKFNFESRSPSASCNAIVHKFGQRVKVGLTSCNTMYVILIKQGLLNTIKTK
jgi:hypothetical protein